MGVSEERACQAEGPTGAKALSRDELRVLEESGESQSSLYTSTQDRARKGPGENAGMIK